MEEEHSFDYKKEIAQKVKLLGLKSKRFSYSEIGSKAKKEIDRARSKHRTDIELDDWRKLKYYKNYWCQKALFHPPNGMQDIAYEEYDKLSIEEFREKYEKMNKPVIIKGCTAKWPAHHKWNFDVINLFFFVFK